jgi:alpha-L-glutamate ligase-like protein
MLATIRRLRAAGVLGLNERNIDFISRHNPRRCYLLADDKLRTKQAAIAAGIAVPELYATIEVPHEVHEVEARVGDRREFVIKPASGSGGDGVLVVTGRSRTGFRTTDGRILGLHELEYHLTNILSGIYSLGGQTDKGLIEYRVHGHPVFDALSFRGVPDVRVVVFLGVPVMAMVRLPTLASRGRANLHQGAIGAGIDLASGATMTAVWHNEIVDEHPDTGAPVSGTQIPYWDEILRLAARCYELTGLGYQGIDIVIDRDRGPLLLEINVRPGLNIQIANRAGLRERLRRVEQASAQEAGVEERVALARRLFRAAA